MYLFLFLLWVMLNGKITLEIILFGVVISAVMLLFMCKFFDYSLKKEMLLYKITPLILSYMIILICEVVKANAGALKIIMNPKISNEPKVFTFISPVKTELGKVMLANSITLTPGTITVDISEDDVYTIHCLDPDLAEGIENSVFVEKILKIEEVMAGV